MKCKYFKNNIVYIIDLLINIDLGKEYFIQSNI